MSIKLSNSAGSRRIQKGVMLLEGLIAILVFSLGILAMVGMQATSIGHTTQAKYRADASFLANKLIAQMWVDSDPRMPLYNTGGAAFNTWLANEVQAKLTGGLSTATVAVAPFVATGAAGLPSNGFRIDITIQWRAPNERTDLPAHVYRTRTQIVRNAPVPAII
jgi:type IV pilus assembly protein PilV